MARKQKKPANDHLSLDEIQDRAEKLRSFRDEIAGSSVPDAETRQLALGAWSGFPLHWAGCPEFLQGELSALHKAATDYLIRLADACGIDDGIALHRAGVVCRQLFEDQNLWNLNAESRSYPTWPECLGQHSEPLSENQ